MPPKKSGVSQIANASSCRRTTRSQTELRKTRIYSLPVELLRIIFIAYFHVSHAPVLLLLVCKQWRDIALDISSLWNTITFNPPIIHSLLPKFKETIHESITCISFKQLGVAGKRAEGSFFNLVCNLTNFDLYAEADPDVGSWISSSCRRIYIVQSLGNFKNFVTSFIDFTNLEVMGLSCCGFDDSGLHLFVCNVEKTALKLTKLIISEAIPSELERYPALLERLQILEVTTPHHQLILHIETGFFEHLSKLEVLQWPYGVPSNLASISGNLQILSISQCTTFPPLDFPRLVSLHLKCVDTSRALHVSPLSAVENWASPIHFPVLEKLNYTGDWSNFTLIQAPILLSLTVNFHNLSRGDDSMKPTTLRPRVVTFHGFDIDKRAGDFLASVWAHVQDLRWISPSSDIEDVFVGLWSLFVRRGEVLCPRLQTFTLDTLDRGKISRPDRKFLLYTLDDCVDMMPALQKMTWTTRMGR